MTLTFGSCFAGIGGIDLGLERAGMECRWQVERDPFCRAVLAKHWPHVWRWRDACLFSRRAIEAVLRPVDLIAGGYPCQPFFDAGKRLGERDPRHLWPALRRIVGVLRPRLVFLENVPGHLARGFGRVLGDLAELGYDAEWDVLSAAQFGAPHLRKRVFIVARDAYGIGPRPGTVAEVREGEGADAGGGCVSAADAALERSERGSEARSPLEPGAKRRRRIPDAAGSRLEIGGDQARLRQQPAAQRGRPATDADRRRQPRERQAHDHDGDHALGHDPDRRGAHAPEGDHQGTAPSPDSERLWHSWERDGEQHADSRSPEPRHDGPVLRDDG